MGRLCAGNGRCTGQARMGTCVGYCVIIMLSVLDFAASSRPTFHFDAGVLEKNRVVYTASNAAEIRVQPANLKMQAGPEVKIRSSSCSLKFEKRHLNGLGSAPPHCNYKCRSCNPCTAVHVPIKPGLIKLAEYYPEAWRCQCGGRLYVP
ncbi:hypothetical protein O6H91_14G051200 [Diphasiastrum complanatum]|uniref:Uncharacterized protein n=1 Tax=Diphasiastrum complanatum TaxID=34168 RepID=A0ACC2BP93_DIPCM|nr:hypothetical protein O6H91_Y450200 [Diphasiastrum complanatum]KAJ7531614.1 hypothetical protein O6H91_14G051200 [Diphasiastrum complanatum]